MLLLQNHQNTGIPKSVLQDENDHLGGVHESHEIPQRFSDMITSMSMHLQVRIKYGLIEQNNISYQFFSKP